jgi:hippurate hydrolase
MKSLLAASIMTGVPECLPMAWSQEALSQAPSVAVGQSIETWIEKTVSQHVELYQWLHTHPEVSLQEKETAAKLAEVWRAGGLDVTQGVGGHGIVGILKNGPGPVVMLRTDLDALPVEERTGLPYASTAKVELPDGSQSGVMHACGHDLHMTCVTAAGRFLADHRDAWSGTLMLIGQPAEERGLGAKAMLNDGLFQRFPKPDFALALHVESATPAGTVSLRPGYMLANVDSVDIVVRGKGGHGAAPDTTVDPIVQAAELVLSLQGIVAREVKPTEPAVVTVGAIHGGTKHNIIGETCQLQLTVRSYSQEVRDKVLGAIRRRAEGIAKAWGAPPPDISLSEGTPALKNDEGLTERMRAMLTAMLGSDRVAQAEQVMGGEDFSQYGLAGVPISMIRLGVIAPERLARYTKLGTTPPSLHSPEFYPDLDGSLATGVTTLSIGALELMPPKR